MDSLKTRLLDKECKLQAQRLITDKIRRLGRLSIRIKTLESDNQKYESKKWRQYFLSIFFFLNRKVRTDDPVDCLKTATPVKMYKYLYKYIYIGELLYIIHGIKYCIDKHSTKPDYLHIPALYRFNNNRYKIRGFCAYREIQRHFKHGSTPPPSIHNAIKYLQEYLFNILESKDNGITELIVCGYYTFKKLQD